MSCTKFFIVVSFSGSNLNTKFGIIYYKLGWLLHSYNLFSIVYLTIAQALSISTFLVFF